MSFIKYLKNYYYMFYVILIQGYEKIIDVETFVSLLG